MTFQNFSLALRQSYQETPDQIAIHLLHSRQPNQAITYRQLLRAAVYYADAFERAGIQPGEVVILILQHGLDLIAAFFGAVLRGATPSIMPFLTEKLHPEQYRASLAALFEITTPSGLVTYADFIAEARRASAGTSVRAALVSEEIASQLQSPTTVVDIHWERLPGLKRSPDDIVLLQHSSGTTGLQKGVALSHRAVFNQLESYADALELRPIDVIVSWLPLYHDMGLIAGFIMPILIRVPLVLMSPFDWVRAPYRLMQAISRFQGTLCWLPNFAYNFCAQKIRDRDLDNVNLSSLRAVINCSEPMHWKSHSMFAERFRDFGFRPEALATSYAMAENVFAVTQAGIRTPVTVDIIDQQNFQARQIATPAPLIASQNESGSPSTSAGQPQSIKMLSAGVPIAGVHLRVLDTAGNELPERHIGEIAIQSNCMLTGYFHRPDLTEKAFLNGWYLTGDLGYLADGELYITGRKKDLIIVGGKNIYPQDLERLAEEVEGVHPGRVVAFGVFNEQTGTEDIILIAEVHLEGFAEASTREEQSQRVAAEIRQRVTHGSDVALRHVHVVDRNWLIKTSSGKVARAANREKFLAEFATG
jgi:acyl-CoA synthetase (AMP-forming)/AMP-acid ligase II